MSNVADGSSVCSGGRGGRDRVVTTDISGRRTIADSGDARQFTSRMACYAFLVQELDKYPSTRPTTFDHNYNYAADFNSWLMGTGFSSSSVTYKNMSKNPYREARFEVTRTLEWTTDEGPVIVTACKGSQMKREADQYVCFNVFQNIRRRVIPQAQNSSEYIQNSVGRVTTQMDVTEQGEVTQSSDKQQNTIITRDQSEATSLHTLALDSAQNLASSEALGSFPYVTERWMPLDVIKMSTSQDIGTVLSTVHLPKDVYKNKCAPGLAPFEAYIYGRLDMEIKAVVNASKFSVGKLVLSTKYDTYYADDLSNGYQGALTRNHVIIDVAAVNEARISVPFRYHRPYLRLIRNENASTGVSPGQYASTYVHVLSKLQTGNGGPSEIEIRLYYRFKQAEFTGMSFRATVQMDSLLTLVEDLPAVGPIVKDAEQIARPVVGGLKNLLVAAESMFEQKGRSTNQDKPSIIESTIVVPQPRMGFPTGKGLVDARPLRINPYALTNYAAINVPTDEPKSFEDLAHIWGVWKSFKWNATKAAGSELFDAIIDPTSRSYTADHSGELTPVEYACGNFAFWSGDIEIRFDFVSNSFHNGTVQITAEFGRKTTSTNECESSSTYTKNFHLGEQKSVDFRVPYIYDTIMRRTTAGVYDPYEHVTASNDIYYNSLTIAPESRTHLKVKVMTQLRPIQTAPQEIEVLVFMRGGKNFKMHGLKANTNRPSVASYLDDAQQFPLAYKPSSVTGEAKDMQATPPVEAQTSTQRRRPVVQMDTGAKEDLDPTDNFAVAADSTIAVSTDSQISFKDLLRRPTLLHYNITVKTQKNGAYFIPLRPPTREYATTYANDHSHYIMNHDFAATLPQTTAMSITNMFRCWRGGMRYTIVSSGKLPLYVMVIPHSGTQIYGNRQFTTTGLEYPFVGSNFVSEMMIPSINPTMVVEVPYVTENTWTLMYTDQARVDFAWRDKGDYNSGHLVIQAMEDTKITVFWSAADDFEVANFYGIPATQTNAWAYRLNDTHATVQMDDQPSGFRLSETLTSVTGLNLSKKAITRAVIGSVPVVGLPFVMGEAMTGVEETMTGVAERASCTMDKIGLLAQKTETTIDDFTKTLNIAVEKISETTMRFIGGTAIIYDFVLDVLIAWMEGSWRIVGMAFVRAIGKACSTNIALLVPLGIKLGEYISTLVSDGTPRVQAEDDRSSTLIGILCGVIGTVFGVVLDPGRSRPGRNASRDEERSFIADLGTRMTQTSGISYLVQILRFVKAVFGTVRDLVFEALGMVSPEAQALKMLQEKSTYIKDFVTEAQIVTSESNSLLINTPRYRTRVWKAVLQAHQIQRLIVQVPLNAVSTQLVRLCAEVIKFGNEKFLDLAASPVRYEPWVLCIGGKSRVGKSHVVEDLAAALLKSIGYQNPSTESVYYRTAGERFWSGYRGQPVICFDEWFNTTSPERCVEQVVEIMKLKSTAMFIPEMAHLEEKKIRGNPLIIILLTNDPYPTLSDYAKTPEAVFSRRDVVLECSRTPQYEGVDMHQYAGDPGIGAAKPHLQFRKFASVLKRSQLSAPKDYISTLEFLTTKFQRYHVRETEMVKRRMEKLPVFCQTEPSPVVLEDPFTLFYGLNNTMAQDPDLSQNGWTPYEQMEAAVAMTMNAISTVPTTTELVADVEWDELVNACHTQSFAFLGGVLFASNWLQPILQATKDQIGKWISQSNPIRTRDGWCSVCHDHVQCAYVCSATYNNEGDAQHLMCLRCEQHNREIGTGHCPMCRHSQIVLWVTPEEGATLCLWMRFAVTCGRGVQWVLSKIINWFGWRRENFFGSLYADLVWSLCLTIINGNTDFMQGLTAGNYLSLAVDMTSRLVTMSQDDWEEEEEPVLRMAQVRDEDLLRVGLNEPYLQRCCDERVFRPICFHRLLEGASHMTASEAGWQVVDNTTHRIVTVPYEMCEECFLTPEAYKEILRVWISQQSTTLRHLYIDYVNTPNAATRQRIPHIVRQYWMDEVVLPEQNDWWTYLTEYYTRYKTFLVYAAGILGVMTTMLGIYNLATYFTADGVVAGGETQAMIGSGEASPRHIRPTLMRATGERRYFQAQDTPSVFEVVQHYVAKNMVTFVLRKDGIVKRMHGVGFFNNVVLIPKHYVKTTRQHCAGGWTLSVAPSCEPQLAKEITFDTDNVRESATDLAYVILPPKFPLFKDLRKFCATDVDLTKAIPAQGRFMMGPTNHLAPVLREVEVDIKGIRPRMVILNKDDSEFILHDSLVYNHSRDGDCGGILLCENTQRPIMCMHVAGTTPGVNPEGYGVLLTQETLANFDGQPSIQMADVGFGSVEDAKFVFETDVHLRYLGSLPPNQVPHVPTKSKLVKSEVFGEPNLCTDMEPAILSAQDPRYTQADTPLVAGIAKHGKLTSDFKRSQVDRACERLWDGWISKLKPVMADPHKLTPEEAILGLALPFCDGMDLNTSAGWPYCCTPQRTSKADWIKVKRDTAGRAIEVEEIDPLVLKNLQDKEKLRLDGQVPPGMFVDAVKDEKRSHEKAISYGGTRVFSIGPVEDVIAVRQSYLPFLSAFMANRADMMHCIGTNALGPEWSDITRGFLEKNTKFCTIDYSNFGPGFNSLVAEGAFKLMQRWTSAHVKGTCESELWALTNACLQAVHVANNTVYQAFAGSPSGSPFTTVINSLVNQLYLLIAFESLIVVPEGETLMRIWNDNVSMRVYGDDVCFTITDDYLDQYNTKTITEFFRGYGIVATSADKGAKIEPWVEMSKATFLKRGFLLHPTREGKFLSPLAEKSIKSTTQWVWKSANNKQATHVNCAAAVVQAHGHGKAYFQRFKNDVNASLLARKIPPVQLLWEEIDELFFKNQLEHYYDHIIN